MKLDRLKADRSLLRMQGDVKAQSYDRVPSSAGSYSEPVFEFLANIETLEQKIFRLERITDPVKKLMTALANDGHSCKSPLYLAILSRYYFNDSTVYSVVNELHLSRSAFFNLKRLLVRKAMSFFGF